MLPYKESLSSFLAGFLLVLVGTAEVGRTSEAIWSSPYLNWATQSRVLSTVSRWFLNIDIDKIPP